MKHITKRMGVMLLLVAMLLSLATPLSVFAVETTTYNIGYSPTGASIRDNATLIAETTAKYKSDQNNWMVQEVYNASGSGYNYLKNSAKMYTYTGDYIVYRIKSPGAGVRSLTLTHGTFFRSGIVSVYILPADTEDVAAQILPRNRIGKIDFYNENTNTTTDVKWSQQTVIGSYEFGNADEYLLVFQCSEPTPINASMCYFYLQSLTITEGELTPTPLPTRVRSMIVSDMPIKNFELATYAATAEINGQPHIVAPIEGKKTFIYNVETGEKYDEVDTRFTVCRGITQDPAGNIWMVGSHYTLQCYNPYTKTIKNYSTYGAMESGFDLVYGDNGCLYFGSSSNAHVYEFNIATETLRDFGNFNADTAYACGIAYDPAGYIYAGLTGNKNSDDIHTREVVKIRLSDGVCVGRTDVSDCVNKKEIMIRGAAFSAGIYIAGGSEMDKIIAIDTATMEQTELICDGKVITNVLNFSPSESYNGKNYFVLSSKNLAGEPGSHRVGLYSIDNTTGAVEFVTGKITNSLKCTQDSIITVNGEPCVFWAGSGFFRYWGMESDTVTELNELVGNNDGTSLTMDSIAAGHLGSGHVYVGAFNNEKSSIFDINSGKIIGNFYTNGQTDCMIAYNGELYVGNYKSGTLVQVDMENRKNNKTLIDFRYTLDPNGEPFSQVRVHALAAGDGKVFAGTMPDSYLRGGCIGWYDTVTGETYIERNVVENQSINSLAYHDGYLYGTTTIAGGTGAGTDTSLSAKMFIYDVANKRKVAEIDMLEEVEGLVDSKGNPRTRLSYIGGVAVDPNADQNGKVWCVVAEALVSVVYNKTTGKYVVNEEFVLNKAKDAGGGAKGREICFLGDYVYCYFSGSTLFVKIDRKNPTSYQALPVAAPNHYTIAEDNNLYYYVDNTLYMYPLDVTAEDETAARNVDQLIIAAARSVTAQSESAVAAARAAYEALKWDQKALVQNRDLLEDAECELLDALLLTVDLEAPNQELVNRLQSMYDAMSATQRTYVANFSILRQAQEILKNDVYAIGDTIYSTWAAALDAATEGTVIKLLCNREEDDVELPNGVILDMNGYRFVCDTLDAAAIGNGHVIDSSDGNGLLQVKDMLLLRDDNQYLPLWDSVSGGYRLFSYTFTVDYEPEKVSDSTMKYWYKLEFAAEAAYELIATGRTDLQIGVDLWWDEEHLVKVFFGGAEGDTMEFAVQWAQSANGNPNIWIYAQISGMDEFGLKGTLEVVPLITAGGVKVQPSQGDGSFTQQFQPFKPGYTERT